MPSNEMSVWELFERLKSVSAAYKSPVYKVNGSIALFLRCGSVALMLVEGDHKKAISSALLREMLRFCDLHEIPRHEFKYAASVSLAGMLPRDTSGLAEIADEIAVLEESDEGVSKEVAESLFDRVWARVGASELMLTTSRMVSDEGYLEAYGGKIVVSATLGALESLGVFCPREFKLAIPADLDHEDSEASSVVSMIIILKMFATDAEGCLSGFSSKLEDLNCVHLADGLLRDIFQSVVPKAAELIRSCEELSPRKSFVDAMVDLIESPAYLGEVDKQKQFVTGPFNVIWLLRMITIELLDLIFSSESDMRPADAIRIQKDLFELWYPIYCQHNEALEELTVEIADIRLRPNRQTSGWYDADDMYAEAKRAHKGLTFEEFVESAERNVLRKEEKSPKRGNQVEESVFNDCMDLAYVKEYHKYGRPYFKVESAIAAELMVSEVNVLASHLRWAYPAFAIRLPRGSNLIFEMPDRPGRSYELHSVSVLALSESLTEGGACHDFGYTRVYTKGQFIVFLDIAGSEVLRGGKTTGSRDYRVSLAVSFNPDDKLEDLFVSEVGDDPNAPLMFAAWRLAIGVMFFSVEEHEFIQPDIPRKLVTRYKRARENKDKEAEEAVIAEAKKRNSGGKVIRETVLPSDVITYIDGGEGSIVKSAKADGERGKHKYGSWRRPHRHTYHTKEGTITKYLPKIRVRPDLPLPEFRGYSLRDELLERKKAYVEARKKT